MSLILRALLCVALCVLGRAGVAVAQDVTLISPDGSVEISGNFLGFDGEFYRIDTIYGELTVDGSGVLCEGPACPNLKDFVAEVTFSGAATMGQSLLPALIRDFAARSGYVVEERAMSDDTMMFAMSMRDTNAERARFFVRSTTTTIGFANLLDNAADAVMALREVRPEERDAARDGGLGDLKGLYRSRVVALDGMVPIVRPDNPLRQITSSQLSGVLSGELVSWSDLGGVDAQISVHLPASSTGLGQSLQDQLFGPQNLEPGPNFVFHDRPTDLRSAVLRDPFAIGVVSYSEVKEAMPLVLKGSCGFVLEAARRTIKTEDYPLTAPMFLYVPARRLPKVARDFLEYTRSADAQNVVRQAGFVDQSPEEVSLEEQGNRLTNAIRAGGPEINLSALQRMVSTLAPMKRLTLTFRFEAGSVRLDAQSRSNIEELAFALENGVYDGRRLLLAGFSDSNGSAEANQRIAERRARAVKDALIATAETADFDRIQLEIDAFGEAMPMACDDSAWGRQVNRRVEVWVQ